MGNILPILISYNLHKEHIDERQRQVIYKRRRTVPLLKEEKRFNAKWKNNDTNNM